MDVTFIYILSEPLHGNIRYVGKTKDPNRRLKRHISERNLHDSYKDRWIRKIIDLHHEEAKNNEVKIVNSCGFDSIPSSSIQI